MYIDESIQDKASVNVPDSNKAIYIIAVLALMLVAYLVYAKYQANQTINDQTIAIIAEPKVNDIYFLDFRLLSDKLRPKNKYRIAKVVDITGDIVTLLYGSFFYQHQKAAMNSIYYGQLSYKDYFESKRYDLPHGEIKKMYTNNAIYLAKRPFRNKLMGQLVGPESREKPSTLFIYGKMENTKGEAFLAELHSETNLASAYGLFQQSSTLGYAPGQLNLAAMYIDGMYIDKNLTKALYWLKQASLQSSKSAILKYGIICKQVVGCEIFDFYQELVNSGVDIEVRELDFELSK
jgi:hypothetical protein